MSRTVYRISIALLTTFLSVSSASAADRDTTRDGEDRWVPSLALVFGFLTQEQSGAVSSVAVSPGFPAPQPAVDNRKFETGLLVGGNLELLTPALPLPLRPRFFVSGEIVSVSAQRRDIALEGDPNGITEPDATLYPVEAITGLGANTTTDLENRLYGARAGLSFPVEIADWQLSIKPAAAYIHQKMNFGGSVYQAYRPDVAGPTRAVSLLGSDSSDVDAVGPSLEIEIETTRIKSLAASVYINGGVYHILSDRSIDFSTTAKDSLGIATYRADWNVELEPWIYRAAVGFRVKWLGVPSGWLGRGDNP